MSQQHDGVSIDAGLPRLQNVERLLSPLRSPASRTVDTPTWRHIGLNGALVTPICLHVGAAGQANLLQDRSRPRSNAGAEWVSAPTAR